MSVVDERDRRLRFTFVTPCVGEDFFRPVKRGMRDAAAMLGVDCSFEGTEDVDLDEQIDIMRRALVSGADGIALSLIHATAFGEVLADAGRRDVPVVVVNVDASHGTSGCLSAICQDFSKAGRVLGTAAARELPKAAKVLLTLHSEGISALDERAQGAQEVLMESGIAWAHLVTGIDPEGAAEAIALALDADSTLAGVLCTGLADMMGAARALERVPQRDLYIAGFDVAPEVLRHIKDGRIAFTIDQQPYVQGFYPVVQLAQYCRYRIRPSDIDAGATVVGPADVDCVMAASEAGYR